MVKICTFKESAKSPDHLEDKGWCEDAITPREFSDGSHVICISDGCGSANKPELGASLLSQYASGWAQVGDDLFKQDLRHMYKIMGVEDIGDVLATLNHLYIDTAAGTATFTIIGDGCWFYKTKSGKLHLFSIEFAGNAPHFIQYELTGRDVEIEYNGWCSAYIDDFAQPCEIPISGREWLPYASSKRFSFTHNLDDLELVGIASDGLTSFRNKDRTPLKLNAKDILEKFLSHTRSYYYADSCKEVIQKLWNDGVYHYDDFSIGVARLGDK